MRFAKPLTLAFSIFVSVSIVWACAFDDTLREYLDVHFWLPFAKHASYFEKKDVRRISVPYAGMLKSQDQKPLAKLRSAYQEISQPVSTPFDPVLQQQAVAEARADQSLTRRDREEVDLIDAKIDMRAGQPAEPELLIRAKEKLNKFLATAQTPEFLSEARGWLAHIHFLLGAQTDAGKIYLDELNRNGSNLSRETLLNSLRMTYRYDGGPELLSHLEEYFDTPEHAAFAIQLVTNPSWDRRYVRSRGKLGAPGAAPDSYRRVSELLEKHRSLLESNAGANTLALLTMRTALRSGDPSAAVKFASAIPADATIRSEPEFNWMLASAYFVSRQYDSAEQPLIKLFQSRQSSENEKAAAAYGLCGVYAKTGNTTARIRFALWLHAGYRNQASQLDYPTDIKDQSIYWAASGWDLNNLLETETTSAELKTFLVKHPQVADVDLVRYALAVHLARENRYEDAARVYESVSAGRRAARMRQLAALYRDAGQSLEAKYRLAEFISANQEKIYFNDRLWSGLQRYALVASDDIRLTGQEREKLMEAERKLKDDQEERWRAYLILRDVVHDAGKNELGLKAAALAIRCLRQINERFGRQDEIRKADIELSKWVRQRG